MDLEKKKNKKKKLWCVQDEEYLVELWAAKNEELRGCRKNGHIFREMSAAFEGRKEIYTPDEIKTKLHNMTNRYKKEKLLIGPSGGSPSEWQLYSKIHAILGEHRIHNLQLIQEDSRPAAISSPPPPSSWFDENSLSYSASSASPADLPSTSTSRPRQAKKRRLCLSEDLNEVNTSIDKLMDKIIESDTNYFQLEKERNDILREFVSDSKEFHRGVLNFLNKQEK